MIERNIYQPPIKLQEYIDSFGIVEVREGETESYLSPPLAMSGIIIQSINTNNSVIVKLGDRDFFTEYAVGAGQVTSSVYGQFVGHTKSLLVFFKPLGMYQLFGPEMSIMTSRAVSLYDFLGYSTCEDLLERLKADQNNEHQIKILSDFLLERVHLRKDTGILPSILEVIHEKKGNISVAEIENQFKIQRKTLERNFQRMIGLSPREYTKIYRFKCLINILMSSPGITWTELSHRAGFYDQAHMSRYVKEYLKVSPSNMVHLDMDLINYLLRN